MSVVEILIYNAIFGLFMGMFLGFALCVERKWIKAISLVLYFSILIALFINDAITGHLSYGITASLSGWNILFVNIISIVSWIGGIIIGGFLTIIVGYRYKHKQNGI